MSAQFPQLKRLPGTPNNQFKVDLWWFPTMSHHPIEKKMVSTYVLIKSWGSHPLLLPETNIAPENWSLEDVFPIRKCLFSGAMLAVRFRECITPIASGGPFSTDCFGTWKSQRNSPAAGRRFFDRKDSKKKPTKPGISPSNVTLDSAATADFSQKWLQIIEIRFSLKPKMCCPWKKKWKKKKRSFPPLGWNNSWLHGGTIACFVLGVSVSLVQGARMFAETDIQNHLSSPP